MRFVLFALLFLFLTVLLPAQSAAYTTGGTGCGSAALWCLANNPNGGTLKSSHNSNTFALEVTTGTTPTPVRGFELFTQATSTITTPTFLYDADSAGKPGKTLATGSIKIGTATGWYTTMFTTPVMIQPNTKFFISYTPVASTMMFPFLNTGANGTHYWHSPTSASWSGPFSTVKWAWRVLCPGGPMQAPVLGNSGLPQIGTKMSVTLDKARAATGTVLTLGLSNTTWLGLALPFDLTFLGGPGCSLLNSIMLVMPATTSGTGQASMPLAIPNDPMLMGGTFYNQWIVVDPSANALGLAFSDGGKGTMGT